MNIVQNIAMPEVIDVNVAFLFRTSVQQSTKEGNFTGKQLR